MKLLIIYAHPEPESFNHAILERVRTDAEARGHEVRIKDLYAEDFDPRLTRAELKVINAGGIPETVKAEQDLLEWADQLAFIYPVWWHDKPAILRGWIDRVLLQGFAYDLTAKPPRGLLKHKQAFIFVTTGAPEVVCKLLRTKQKIIWAIKDAVLATCGIHKVHMKLFYGIPASSLDQRKDMLEEVSKLIAKHLK